MFIGRDSEDTHLLITTQSEPYNIGKTDKSESFDDFFKNLYIKLAKVWKHSCMQWYNTKGVKIAINYLYLSCLSWNEFLISSYV